MEIRILEGRNIRRLFPSAEAAAQGPVYACIENGGYYFCTDPASVEAAIFGENNSMVLEPPEEGDAVEFPVEVTLYQKLSEDPEGADDELVGTGYLQEAMVGAGELLVSLEPQEPANFRALPVAERPALRVSVGAPAPATPEKRAPPTAARLGLAPPRGGVDSAGAAPGFAVARGSGLRPEFLVNAISADFRPKERRPSGGPVHDGPDGGRADAASGGEAGFRSPAADRSAAAAANDEASREDESAEGTCEEGAEEDGDGGAGGEDFARAVISVRGASSGATAAAAGGGGGVGASAASGASSVAFPSGFSGFAGSSGSTAFPSGFSGFANSAETVGGGASPDGPHSRGRALEAWQAAAAPASPGSVPPPARPSLASTFDLGVVKVPASAIPPVPPLPLSPSRGLPSPSPSPSGLREIRIRVLEARDIRARPEDTRSGLSPFPNPYIVLYSNDGVSATQRTAAVIRSLNPSWASVQRDFEGVWAAGGGAGAGRNAALGDSSAPPPWARRDVVVDTEYLSLRTGNTTFASDVDGRSPMSIALPNEAGNIFVVREGAGPDQIDCSQKIRLYIRDFDEANSRDEGLIGFVDLDPAALEPGEITDVELSFRKGSRGVLRLQAVMRYVNSPMSRVLQAVENDIANSKAERRRAEEAAALSPASALQKAAPAALAPPRNRALQPRESAQAVHRPRANVARVTGASDFEGRPSPSTAAGKSRRRASATVPVHENLIAGGPDTVEKMAPLKMTMDTIVECLPLFTSDQIRHLRELADAPVGSDLGAAVATSDEAQDFMRSVLGPLADENESGEAVRQLREKLQPYRGHAQEDKIISAVQAESRRRSSTVDLMTRCDAALYRELTSEKSLLAAPPVIVHANSGFDPAAERSPPKPDAEEPEPAGPALSALMERATTALLEPPAGEPAAPAPASPPRRRSTRRSSEAADEFFVEGSRVSRYRLSIIDPNAPPEGPTVRNADPRALSQPESPRNQPSYAEFAENEMYEGGVDLAGDVGEAEAPDEPAAAAVSAPARSAKFTDRRATAPRPPRPPYADRASVASDPGSGSAAAPSPAALAAEQSFGRNFRKMQREAGVTAALPAPAPPPIVEEVDSADSTSRSSIVDLREPVVSSGSSLGGAAPPAAKPAAAAPLRQGSRGSRGFASPSTSFSRGSPPRAPAAQMRVLLPQAGPASLRPANPGPVPHHHHHIVTTRITRMPVQLAAPQPTAPLQPVPVVVPVALPLQQQQQLRPQGFRGFVPQPVIASTAAAFYARSDFRGSAQRGQRGMG